MKEIVENKVDNSISIQAAYDNLNQKMYKNISSEFFDRNTEDVRDNYLTRFQGKDGAPDWHISGDYTYHNDTLRILQPIIKILLEMLLGDTIKLINYINPVNIDVTTENDIIVLAIEGVEVNINLKGDQVFSIPSSLNNNSIKPVVEGGSTL